MVKSLQDRKSRDGGTLAARPWWTAPEAADGPDPCVLTEEEAMLSARLARQAGLGHFRIPQLPAVAARAVALLANPEADPGEISRLIHEDQHLAADVVSFSNSSLFAGAARNTNIPQAILRVGYRRTRSLIFAASLRAVIYSGSEVSRAENLWRHSCACAAMAARIAGNVGANADDLYLAGLFHDVGKTVVFSILDSIALRSRQPPLRPEFVDWVLELHHEAVGGDVIGRWQLSESVVEAVRRHGAGHGGPMTRVQAIVTLANNACHRLRIGAPDDGRPIADRPVMDALGAAEQDLPVILAGVPEAAAAS
jgi:putative nucleotidyltransferase with HDIG domain